MISGNRGAALAVMAGAGLLLGGAGAAKAGQSFSVQETATSSQTLSFSPFDTSLGTLTEVDVLLSGASASLGSTFGITGGEGGASPANGSASFTANLDITGPGAESLFTAGASSSASCSVSSPTGTGSCSDSKPVTLAGGGFTPDPAVLTSPTDLALWDTPSDVDVLVGIDNFVPGYVCTLALNVGSCSHTNDVLFGGQLSVTYDYTPASGVPEPRGIALFGTALLGLGLVRRRRQ